MIDLKIILYTNPAFAKIQKKWNKKILIKKYFNKKC